MATLTPTRIWTAEDVERLPSGQRCELIRGELILMSPASHGHGSIASRFGRRIGNFVEANDLGETYAAETGFILDRKPDTVRGPDAAFVRSDRVVKAERGFFPGPPDLAVEVVSADEREADVLDKVDFWLEKGCRRVWVAWPATRSVTEHDEPGNTAKVYGPRDTIDGGDVLPGFTCPVADIFG